MTWDPDGTGPAGPLLVVGGVNLVGGANSAATRVMTFDGLQWRSLAGGPGTSGQVRALAVWNGQLIAAGDFQGGGTNRIAAWDGSAWQPLGSGFPVAVNAITVWNGELVAAGLSGLSPLLQKWNGSIWTTLPNPPSLDDPKALVSYQGWLCVGGREFTSSANRGVLERWNGSAWEPSIATFGGVDPAIRCFAVRVSQAVGGAATLYVGGSFTFMGATSVNSLASTTGGSAFAWSAVGGNTSSDCRVLSARNTGITGFSITAQFLLPTASVRQFSSFSGTWSSLGTSNLLVGAFTFHSGSLHAASIVGPAACVRWDGTAWIPVLGQGLQGEVRALARSGADLVVGGAFVGTASPQLDRIALWNGTSFQSIGTGMTGTSVDALLARAGGEVVAGGAFTAAGGTAANNIARWNGSAWSGLGTGTNQAVLALCELPNGEVIAAGRFTTAGGVACNRIARWSGNAWSSLAFGFNGDVLALVAMADGTLCAAGSFTAAGATPCSRIARWNGFTWQALGSGCNGDVHALAVRPDGVLVAVGAFTVAGGVAADRCALWNGTTWSTTNSSSADPAPARSVCVLPNGDIVVGRGFHQPASNPDSGISRWSGTSWSGFGSGIAITPSASASVRAMTQRTDGTLVVGGDFGIAGGVIARGLATLTPTCPPSATSFGTGCSSGVGPLVITADALPWVGAPFRTTTTGVTPGSLCLGAIGLSQVSIPLATVVAQGQPGCLLLVSPDILLTLPPGIVTAHSRFVLPNNPALVGVRFFEQTIPFEFGLSGAIAAVRSSNALSLTIGAF